MRRFLRRVYLSFFITLIPVVTLFPDSGRIVADDTMVIYGDYPVIKDLKPEENKEKEAGELLIPYNKGKDYREKALVEALHFLSADIYGYDFIYKPGSILMKTEEYFDIKLKGEIGKSSVRLVGEGVYNNIYRVKLEFELTPSVRKWLSAFYSHTLRLTEAEGTSDFYSGWEGRSAAYREALRNLVLVSAKRVLSSKPLMIKGDILTKGNPEFSVGAGRYYCKIRGWVNIVDVVTYD